MTRRPAVHTETLLALAAVFTLLAGNGPWWRAALAQRAPGEPATWLFAGAMFLALASFYFAFTALFASRHTVKPLLTLLLVVTAFASYYMDRYSVYLDRPMIRNVFATNPKEAGELLGWGLALHVMLFGLLPSAVVWWFGVARRPWKRAVAVRLAFVVGAIALGTASLVLVFADAASLMRKNREMRWLITPGNIVAAVTAETFGRTAHSGPRQVVAPDAKQVPAPGARPILFVLMVGETARAKNFSLNGYARQTNPELAKRGVINFPDATACGTSTEVSLPCMFSALGRAKYDERQILSQESVLHVLARAGVGVLWRDNQSGCKGVCDGLPQEQLDGFDEVLVDGMDRVAKDAKGNMLVVLHALGSHGPAYYRRYPPAFARFQPACATDELRQCPDAEIVNAYDNTILYADHVLGRLVDFLSAAQATHDTGMLYVSDHGESLGESGLYLHGVPYAIAPRVQTHVPFIAWLSPALQKSAGIDEACLRQQAQKPVSHDNLFHSLLGVYSVRSRAYDAGLDVFSGCRTKRSN